MSAAPADHMAIDQHGTTLHGLGPHPRKGLLERLDRKHADRIYVDKRDGRSVHVGWIVAGQWWTVYRVERMEGEA